MNFRMGELTLEERFAGLLLGAAVGDALGLPAENLSAERIRMRWSGEWRMRFVFGRGMISDDTEHTLMVAQALLTQDDDAGIFQRALAWKLRWWFASLPGGVGLATARACIKLWLGFSPERSGVASGGSGPAMRSAILGAYFANDAERRRRFVLASARLTHRSWQAESAARAVADCAAFAMNGRSRDTAEILKMLEEISEEVEWRKMISAMRNSLAAGETVSDFARGLGLERGVTGYSLHVVPVAIYAWQRHPENFRAALVATLDCGGDTDTVGAILGGICGAAMGRAEIPDEWVGKIWEWPRSVSFMEKISARLAEQKFGNRRMGAVKYFWPGIVVRNLIFLVVVLVHGFGRLVPRWRGKSHPQP
jgi:ADP-ribosyl-[dinitrogen reductase] hydrolase